MRARAGILLAAGLLAGVNLMTQVAAAAGKSSDRPQDMPVGAGNWSGSKSEDDIRSSVKPDSAASQDSDRDVPIPRPKPGSKAAKAEAEAAKKKAAAEAAEADKKAKASGQKEDSEEAAAVPAPKAKPKKEDDKPVQAGLVPGAGDSGDAPYRGNLEKDEIKSILTGKVVASRIDGKDARITLGEEGKLTWTAGDMSGVGFWWAETGRVCDRYDPSGDFPGRGAGCRSFEQKADGYYSGGKRLEFLN